LNKPTLTLLDRIDQKVFDAIYSRSLVYNACWEDPAVDRRALDIHPGDRMLVITSAGCNVLDYALLGPARIYAVDANPRQNALLELKLAGISRLEFDDFFSIFGEGRHRGFELLYRDVLRTSLSPFAQEYWDRRTHWFEGSGSAPSFYYRGLAGTVARAFRGYLVLRPGLRAAVMQLLDARSLEEQRDLYDRHIQPKLWGVGMNWALSRQFTLSMLGVPHPQRKEVQLQHAEGVPGFIREAIEYVFRTLPVSNNYFWSLYLRGSYSRSCCPEYLKPENFNRLKQGLAERIGIHTGTVTGFLKGTQTKISKFVLLDHMDWMSAYDPAALAEEWRAILLRSAPGARVLFRSAHHAPRYLDSLRLDGGGALRQRLRFHDAFARSLEPLDRVHTYAGLHIADIRS